MRKINNAEDLRLEVIDIFSETRDGKMGVKELKEYANAAGKIMQTAKLQLEYNVYMKSGSVIDFLACSEQPEEHKENIKKKSDKS